MLFTLELEGIGMSYRLQKDESWRNTTEEQEFMTSDFATESAYEITSRSYSENTIELEGIIYDIDPRMWPTDHEQLHFTSRVFRRLYPSEPTFEQLIETITLGNDLVSNVLVLNVNGRFELRQSPPFNQLINDPTIVVRHETYVAGNGYVGLDAGKDKKFIEDELTMSLDFWVGHLKNHITQNYSDLNSAQSLEEIRNDLKQIRKNWKPDY
jgi:hypothetical protein